MPTYRQLLKKSTTRRSKKKKCRTPLLARAPHRKAVCIRVYTTTPKKPNSAVRKVAKVRFTATKKDGIVYVPGQGHSLSQHSVVLVRGGRVRDVPGMHYKLIRSKLDFTSRESFDRRSRRSKFGVMSREKEKANLRFLRLIFLHFKKKPMTVKKSLGGVREVPLQHSVIPDKNKKLDPYFYEPESMRKFRFGRFWGSFFSANYDYTARKWLCANQISTSYYLTSDYICHKLINKMMKNGEKQVIYNIFFKVVSALKKEFDVIDPRPNIVRAIMKLRPLVSFKKIVVSGITRKVPASISVRSSVNVALGWFVSSVRSRKEKTIAARLVHEFVSLNFDKPCQSFKKKVEYHGLAKINRYLIKRVPFLKNKKKKTVSARTLKFFKKKWKKV